MAAGSSRVDRALIAFKRIARRRGLELLRHNVVNSFDLQRAMLLRHLAVDLVLDVGAAVGDYGKELRSDGYSGQIVSFEPLAEPFAELSAAAGGDPNWRALRTALSDEAGAAEMNVAANSSSSSLLPMEGRHASVAPESRYVGSQQVERSRLDDHELGGSRLMLKIDVQGSEKAVLAGAASTLERVVLAELELSLVPLYTGGPLFGEMLALLDDSGFRLAGARTALADPRTGEALQLDGLFVRR